MADRNRAEFPTAVPESVGVSSSVLGELAAQVQGNVDRDDIVGAELLIIKDRRTVLHEAAGWRDREDGLAMERGTIFNVRSMTKPVAGTAIQLLIQEGTVSVNDRVATYLDAFDNPGNRDITIEHLLTHRSGIPTMDTLGLYVEAASSLREISDSVGAAGPHGEAGCGFAYTDAGYDTLGAILEVVTGGSLEDYVTRNILMPLGMNDTFSVTDEDDERLSRVCSHYQRDEETGKWTRWWKPTVEGSIYKFMMGAQGLYGSLKDYARFLSLWLDRGQVGSRQMLRPDLVQTALTPVSVVDMAEWALIKSHYGQGWMIWPSSVTGQTTAFGHGGSDGTIAMVWPELDLMALYFTHSRGQTTRMKLVDSMRRLLVS